MTQVICPGCAKLIEVGVLPPGTLPSCPFCRTVFQLAEPSVEAPSLAAPSPPVQAGGRSAPRHEARPPRSPAADTGSADSSPPEDAAASPWRRTHLSFLILFLTSCLLAMVLLLAIALLAHREKQRHDAPDAAAGSWQPVGNYSGHTHMQTAQFRIDSSVWRLKWACTANETPAKKNFQVRVMDYRGKLVGTPVNSGGDERETTLMETEPGMYFLVVRATNVEWELTVEHQP